MLSKDAMQTIIVDETSTLITKTQVESAVPPAFTLAFLAAYCCASVNALYMAEGKKPPAAVKNFYAKTLPKLLSDLDEVIMIQQLELNTEGNC